MRMDMATDGNLGAEWIVGMHQHFGQTGGYRGGDMYRLLGDQTRAFDLIGERQPFATCHEQGVNDADQK